jgi:hypothetical protein
LLLKNRRLDVQDNTEKTLALPVEPVFEHAWWGEVMFWDALAAVLPKFNPEKIRRLEQRFSPSHQSLIFGQFGARDATLSPGDSETKQTERMKPI